MEQYPAEIEAQRRTLRPVMTALQRKGIKEVHMKREYIFINGQRYGEENIRSLLQICGDLHIAAKKNEHVYAFLGKVSPLSNFFRSEFKYGSHYFTSVEMGYQFAKAQYADRDNIAMEIKNLSDPLQIKRMGDSVSSDNWISSGEARKAMRGLLEAKFGQDGMARQCLIETGQRLIVEANAHSDYWGIRLAKWDPKVFDIQSWLGKNEMGRLLCDIRKSLA